MWRVCDYPAEGPRIVKGASAPARHTLAPRVPSRVPSRRRLNKCDVRGTAGLARDRLGSVKSAASMASTLPTGRPRRRMPSRTLRERLASIGWVMFSMLRYARRSLVIVAIAPLGCANPEQRAVSELVAFISEAPFTIGAPAQTRWYSGYVILVEDSALSQYNKIFQYFDPSDTARATVYRNLPTDLLVQFPITSAQPASFASLGNDTLRATVVFERPHHDLFYKLFDSNVITDDTLPPTDEQRAAFRSGLHRIRRELQETDTLLIWVMHGPRIVHMATASRLRDSLLQDSLAQIARVHLQGLVAEARVRVNSVDDFSTLLPMDVSPGGTVEGTVDPGVHGWYRGDKRLYWSVDVECEGRRGNQVTRDHAYMSLPDIGERQQAKYTCIWVGEKGRDWARVRPVQFRARLVVAVRGDSMRGAWADMR